MTSCKAQVDSSLGTYSCYPCGRALCGFENGGSTSTMINPEPIFGNNAARDFQPISCRDFQHLADRRQVDPEMCAYYSQLTLSSSDPCSCKKRTTRFAETSTSENCIDPNQPQPCKLCRSSTKIIGDPEKTLPRDSGYYSTCASFVDRQEENLAEGGGGFSTSMCRDLQGLFAEHCQCVEPGTPVTQCVAQMDLDSPCNPSLSNDQCCVGECKYLNNWRRYMCTTLPGDPAPPMSSTRPPTPAPTRAPTPAPTRSPTPAPTKPPTPIPTRFPTRFPTPSPTDESESESEDEFLLAAPPKNPGAVNNGGISGSQGNALSLLSCDSGSDCPSSKFKCENGICVNDKSRNRLSNGGGYGGRGY